VCSIADESNNSEGFTRHTDTKYHILDSSDNLIVLSRYQHESNNMLGGIQVLKFDPSGNLLWSKLYSNDFVLSPILDNEDNLVFITGTDHPHTMSLIKLGPNGQSIWSTDLPSVEVLQIDSLNTIGIDSRNNIVIVGHIDHNNYPVSNGYQSEFAGGEDVIIAKFDENGFPIWSTYFGGVDYEILTQWEFDQDDNIILCGQTLSSDFPLSNNPVQAELGGERDVFLSKISKNGDLIWSTYIGGSSDEVPQKFLIDSQNNIFLTGNTLSSDFPLKEAISSNYSYQDLYFGAPYLIKFTSSGEMSWSTYIGGDGTDVVTQIKLTSKNELIILGMTSSNNFMGVNVVLNDDIKNLPLGEQDLLVKSYILKITSDRILSWNLFFDYLIIDPYGWTFNFDNYHFTLDQNNSIFLVGTTSNSNNIGLMLNDTPLMTFSGSSDLFLIKLNSFGILEWSTYLGGSGYELDPQVIVDSNNNLIITGYTDSVDFPTKNALQSLHSSNYTLWPDYYENTDVLIIKTKTNGEIVWSSYLGGTDSETVENVLLDSQDRIYVIGETKSNDFPLDNSYSSSFNGNTDTFISVFNDDGQASWSTYLGPIEEDSQEKSISPWFILAAVMTLLSIPVIYYVRRKKGIIPTELMDRIISGITGVNPEIIYLITGAQKVSVDKKTYREFMKQVPPDLLEYKFLLHPVRLAILKVMYDYVNLTTIQLKEKLGLTWTEFNNGIKSMKRADLLHEQTKFVDGNVRIIVTLTNLGISQFQDLKRLLIDFLSDFNTYMYIQYVNGIKEMLYPEGNLVA
jgi:hypothetical protein